MNPAEEMSGAGARSSSKQNKEQKPEGSQVDMLDVPPESWKIPKLITLLKRSNQAGSAFCLAHIMTFDMKKETSQKALLEAGGIQILCNLLATNHSACTIGSLKILKEVCRNEQIHQTMVQIGALRLLVALLDSLLKDVKALAAETIANMATTHAARSAVQQHGGIAKLVKLLDYVPPSATPSAEQEKDVEVAGCGALALWGCSVNAENREEIHRAGGVPLLGRLLKTAPVDMLISLVGILQECASEERYRIAIQTEGLIVDLVKHLGTDNNELQMLCASIIFKCAEDQQTRDLVRQHNGLEPLVSLLDKTHNKEHLAAAVGAVWKCSLCRENLDQFQEFLPVETLVGLLTDPCEDVLVSVTGALAEFLQLPANRAAVRKCNGIKPLVGLFSTQNKDLLVNVAKAVGRCAANKANIGIIEQLHGVRQLWSLLNHSSAEVQSSAAWALDSCMESAKDLGEMRFVCGMDQIVHLLNSTNQEVLASICTLITTLAKDKDNLAVLSDHGVVTLLTKRTDTTDKRLRGHVAKTIDQCATLARNRGAFGEAVAPLVGYLKSKSSLVQQNAVKALFQLSKSPRNCLAMYENGAVKPLIDFMGSDDEEVQDAAAGCVRNIRMLARANRASGRTQAQTSKFP